MRRLKSEEDGATGFARCGRGTEQNGCGSSRISTSPFAKTVECSRKDLFAPCDTAEAVAVDIYTRKWRVDSKEEITHSGSRGEICGECVRERERDKQRVFLLERK